MRFSVIAAATMAGLALTAEATAGSPHSTCSARVLHSEELPFAPFRHWLVRTTLEITPPDGSAYEITLQDDMPRQAPPPRRGQKFRVFCDPASPIALRLTR